MYLLSFSVLRGILGAPSRTYRHEASGVPSAVDHVWRCGCSAREDANGCTAFPCEQHGMLKRLMFEQRVADSLQYGRF
jgi:hypothetical protein